MVAHGTVFYLGVLLQASSLVWYFKKGQYLKGWVGDSVEELKSEYVRLEGLVSEWKYANGSPIPPEC